MGLFNSCGEPPSPDDSLTTKVTTQAKGATRDRMAPFGV
jgi:hypothetical protein